MTKPSQDDVTSTSCSMAGSFISDTITLNGGVGGALGVETASTRAKNNDKNNTNPDKIRPEQTCLEDEEENTENDQDLDDDLFDDDDKDEDGQAARTSVISLDRAHTEKRELLRALNGDLTTLEQLREQKKLLKSIQLRKEELKALEGRRKALEALKKLAATNSTVAGSHSLVELPQK